LGYSDILQPFQKRSYFETVDRNVAYVAETTIDRGDLVLEDLQFAFSAKHGIFWQILFIYDRLCVRGGSKHCLVYIQSLFKATQMLSFLFS